MRTINNSTVAFFIAFKSQLYAGESASRTANSKPQK